MIVDGWARSGLELLSQQTIQVSILCVAVLAIVACLGRRRPHLTHGLWLLVLLKCVTPPVVAVRFAPFCRMHTGARQAQAPPRASQPFLAAQPPGRTAAPSQHGPAPQHSAAASRKGQRQRASASAATGARSVDRLEEPRNRAGRPAASPPRPSDVKPVAGRPAPSWQAKLLAAWAASVVVALAVATMRLARFSHRARRLRVEPLPETAALFAQVCRELGVDSAGAMRRARLHVVDDMIGPAVIGIWRPLVLLPRVLEQDCDARELRILLAHELTHVRRRDLGWALVHSLAVCCWWFHPLVRLAGRRFERDTERCCDEETVAALRCTAVDYARTLLRVLERKHELRAAPAMPGVRPVELTKQRMERIMRMTDARSSRPWHVALLLLLGAAALLPGGVWVVAQDRKAPTAQPGAPSGISPPAAQAAAKNSPASSPAGAPAPDAWRDENWLHSTDPHALAAPIVRRYDVTRQKARIAKEEGVSDAVAGASMSAHLSQLGNFLIGESQSKAICDNNELIASGPPDYHQRIQAELNRILEFGFQEQVAFATRFISLSAKRLNEVNADWSANQRTGAGLPVLTAQLPAAAASELIASLKAFKESQMLMAPKVTVFNGQPAKISNVTQRPFVVGMQPSKPSQAQANRLPEQPTVSLLEDGVSCVVRPVFRDRNFDLSVRLRHSKIHEVDTFSFLRQGKAVTLQLPRVSHDSLALEAVMPEGTTLAIALPGQEKDGSFLMVMLTPQLVRPGEDPGDPLPAPAPPESEASDSGLDNGAEVAKPASPVVLSLKADGPPMARATVDRIAKAFGKAFEIQRLEGSFEEEFSGDDLTLRGKNLSVTDADNRRLRIVSPDGVIRFSSGRQRLRIRSSQGVELTIEDSIRASGEEVVWQNDSDVEWSGKPARLHAKEDKVELQAEADNMRIADSGITMSGNVTISIDEMQLRADRVTTASQSSRPELLLKGSVRVIRNGDSENVLRLESGGSLLIDLETRAIRLK